MSKSTGCRNEPSTSENDTMTMRMRFLFAALTLALAAGSCSREPRTELFNGRDLAGWGTGGDRGDQRPPMVCGVSVPSGIQEPAQPPASAVLRLCKSGAGYRKGVIRKGAASIKKGR